MKREEELLKDLCARLPYDVKVQISLPNYKNNIFTTEVAELLSINKYGEVKVNSKGIDYRIINILRIKPYLRLMSSMTEEERKEHRNTMSVVNESFYVESLETFDFYNKHHIDYRNMLGKDLALEAPKGMYKFE